MKNTCLPARRGKTNFIMLMLSSVLCFTACNIFGQTSVKIGTQEWMPNNLNVATFKNGDAIPEVKTTIDSQQKEIEKIKAYLEMKTNK